MSPLPMRLHVAFASSTRAISTANYPICKCDISTAGVSRLWWRMKSTKPSYYGRLFHYFASVLWSRVVVLHETFLLQGCRFNSAKFYVAPTNTQLHRRPAHISATCSSYLIEQISMSTPCLAETAIPNLSSRTVQTQPQTHFQ